MNKAKKRLLSCLFLLLATGELNLGTGVSNARSKDVTNMSNVSSEKFKRNSKVSDILTVRNGIDFAGLLAIILGGKKLRDKNNTIYNNMIDICEKNKKIEEQAQEIDHLGKQINNLTSNEKNFKNFRKNIGHAVQEVNDESIVLCNFQKLFYYCASRCNFKNLNWDDLKEEEYKKKYEVVCHRKIILECIDCDLQYFFITSVYFVGNMKLKKDDINGENILKNFEIKNGNLRSVVGRVKEPTDVGPVLAAGFAECRISPFSNLKPKFVKITKFGNFFSEYDDGTYYCESGTEFENLKEKIEDYFIVCQVYENEYGDKGYGDYYFKFSLVKEKSKEVKKLIPDYF